MLYCHPSFQHCSPAFTHSDSMKTEICSKPFKVKRKSKLPIISPSNIVLAYLSLSSHVGHPGVHSLCSCHTGHISVSGTRQAISHPKALLEGTLPGMPSSPTLLLFPPQLTPHLSFLVFNLFSETASLTTSGSFPSATKDPLTDNL